MWSFKVEFNFTQRVSDYGIVVGGFDGAGVDPVIEHLLPVEHEGEVHQAADENGQQVAGDGYEEAKQNV